MNFLYYNSKLIQSFDEVWKLLVESETTTPLEENSMLWRLTFFEIRTPVDYITKKHHYAIILTYDHSIMDGRSSYNALLKLMTLIEKMYTFEEVLSAKPTQTEILPSKEEVYKDRPKMVLEQYLNNVFQKVPEFLNQKNAYKSSYIRLKYLKKEAEENDIIYYHNNQPYKRLKDLVNLSQQINSKFRTLVISSEDLAKMLAKCKKNNTKLTSVLNMVMILALQLLYKK